MKNKLQQQHQQQVLQHTQQQQQQQNHQLSKRKQQEFPSLAHLTPTELSATQNSLFNEASCLTRALYRKCLRSVKLLREGNERDELDFREREKGQMKQSDEFDDVAGSDGSDGERISMAPPVNRQNELQSRANYYKTFADCYQNMAFCWRGKMDCIGSREMC